MPKKKKADEKGIQPEAKIEEVGKVSEPVFSVDPTGKVRYAKLQYQGKEAKIRVPLHIFNLKDQEKQVYFMQMIIQDLHKKFKRDFGISIGSPVARP